jgi:hypothetical protein
MSIPPLEFNKDTPETGKSYQELQSAHVQLRRDDEKRGGIGYLAERIICSFADITEMWWSSDCTGFGTYVSLFSLLRVVLEVSVRD